MKSNLMMACCVGLLLLLTIVPGVTHAAVPHQINYQGYLTDPDGNPVPDDVYDMIFTIWDAPEYGNLKWAEDLPVTVTNGIYNVILGLLMPIDPELLDDDIYFGVRVGYDEEEMTPRQKITATAFSMKAAKAEDSDTLDGKDSTEFSESDHSHSFSDISGTATDAQIPNNITINHAATADSANSAAHADSADSADSATHANSADNASGSNSSVSGGGHNTATSYNYASVSGGNNNKASGNYASVSGGQNNTASGDYSSIVGGGSDNPVHGNHAYANYSSILGGILNIAGDPDLVPVNRTVGQRSTISGGDTNRTSGTSSTVSGGVDNKASALRSTVGGGAHLTEDVNEGYKDPDTP